MINIDKLYEIDNIVKKYSELIESSLRCCKLVEYYNYYNKYENKEIDIGVINVGALELNKINDKYEIIKKAPTLYISFENYTMLIKNQLIKEFEILLSKYNNLQKNK